MRLASLALRLAARLTIVFDSYPELTPQHNHQIVLLHLGVLLREESN